jgi:hypothetical protein
MDKTVGTVCELHLAHGCSFLRQAAHTARQAQRPRWPVLASLAHDQKSAEAARLCGTPCTPKVRSPCSRCRRWRGSCRLAVDHLATRFKPWRQGHRGGGAGQGGGGGRGSHPIGPATVSVRVKVRPAWRRPKAARAHRWTAAAPVSSLSTGRERGVGEELAETKRSEGWRLGVVLTKGRQRQQLDRHRWGEAISGGG